VRRPRVAALLAGALLAAALVARPIAHGVPFASVLAFWATVLGQVVLPGVLLVRGARLRGSGDAWLLIGQGASVGLALQGIAMLLGRALGAPWLTTLAALTAAGAGMDQVVKLTVFLTDLADLAVFRRVRGEYVSGGAPPASSLVRVAGLVNPAFRVEIEALAAVPQTSRRPTAPQSSPPRRA